ncbi:hypothetical protein Q9L58_004525 [Maublancomyces gigas]|uniref:Uncharacterized protein n=1 Tax=Discina gigas TaxID=1032678 RepID=A0ABR3GKZ1_9PEZI
MLSRRNTISSTSPATAHATIRRSSRLRRSKTVSHPTPTRSEKLAPEERCQQAVAAAQRAYGDDMQRRKSQIVRFSSPVDNRHPGAVSNGDGNHQTGAAGELNTPTSIGAAINATIPTTPASAAATADMHLSYDASSSPEYVSETSTTKARRWSMQEDLQQQWFTPRGCRSMNFTATGAEGYPVENSTPSSYSRLRKTRSVFSVGQGHQQQPNGEYPSSVVYSSELSPEGVGSRRKSMSFLRGGTDFMPESMRKKYAEEKPAVKERKSFYLPASSRRGQKPIAFPETVRGKKKEQSDEKELSVRKAVGEKARKMSASFFGTMRRAFGKQVKLEPSFPEQHVTSTRQHFRDYVSPSELHDSILDIPEPNNFKIRPAVVSRAPTFRHVPSYEMLRSVTGSIGEASPPAPPPHRDVSVATDNMSTWNATLDKKHLTNKKRLSIIDENMPNKVKEDIYSPPSFEKQQTQKSYEARRVYSALMKRLDRGSPRAKKEEAEYVHGPGYYFAPGLGLRPEEERMFERPYTAASTNTVITAIRKNSGRWRRNSEDNDEPFYPPPVPPIPLFYQQEAADKTISGTNVWLSGTLATEADELMKAASSQDPMPRDITPVPLGDLSATQVSTPISTPGKILRVARSASTFFPYSSSVDEVVRESTPSPYRKATSVMDQPNVSSSSFYSHGTGTTNTPPENTPTQRHSEYMHRSNDSNATAPKIKIKGGLKIKDYNLDWSRNSPLTTNQNYNNTPRNSTKNTPGNNSNSTTGNYGSNVTKPKNKENESQNKTKDFKKKSKSMLRPGNQGLGLHRSRSVLSQMSAIDIENAVNSQFGPVVADSGEMGWKEVSREKVVLQRRDSPMVFL